MSKKALRVITRIEAVSGTEEELKSLLGELVELTRTETGCINYELLQNSSIETEFILLSEWESKTAFLAHLDSDSVETIFREDAELLAKAPDIRQYQLIS
ncbi:MAG: putative quinol monooxygenase [Xenococcaceae cyanobacterium]